MIKVVLLTFSSVIFRFRFHGFFFFWFFGKYIDDIPWVFVCCLGQPCPLRCRSSCRQATLRRNLASREKT